MGKPDLRRFPGLPIRMRALPVDHRGFPVPWFVGFFDGEPDFRVVGPGKIEAAVQHGKCWICGDKLGRFKAYVIGPMCAVNRVSSEPPSHLECATFAAMNCPFLVKPRMRRNEKDLPPSTENPAGVMIACNPGVALVWVTTALIPFRAGDGLLFDVGEPHSLHWYAEGRTATRAEVLASIESGLPILQDAARSDGAAALERLAEMTSAAMRLVPTNDPRVNYGAFA